MTPLQAIEAATANAPMTLGPQAPKSGQLKPGFDADALAVQKDPLGDIGVLTSPENLITVWKSGQAIDRPSR
jgi:imidazolonepropionase-like amidohydrolase